MKRSPKQRFKAMDLILSGISFAFACILLASMTLPVRAEQPANDETDCQMEDITYRTNPDFTRAEQLQAMEKAFFDSLNRFETCNLSNNQSSASADNSDSSGATGANAGASGSQSAVPSAEMQGTESVPDDAPPPMAEGTETESDNTGERPPSAAGLGNGAVPDDIPSANNDDAIAAQIRAAAEAETDPEIKEKLWNEYRKYKGMDIE